MHVKMLSGLLIISIYYFRKCCNQLANLQRGQIWTYRLPLTSHDTSLRHDREFSSATAVWSDCRYQSSTESNAMNQRHFKHETLDFYL